MPLQVYEQGGILHFVSLGYYFKLGTRTNGRTFKLWLPAWLSPGTTHVQHIDEAGGWFRFTMTVSHPVLGEVFDRPAASERREIRMGALFVMIIVQQSPHRWGAPVRPRLRIRCIKSPRIVRDSSPPNPSATRLGAAPLFSSRI